MFLTMDAAAKKRSWKTSRTFEDDFASRLMKIARTIGNMVRGMPVDGPAAISAIVHALERYSDVISPWAKAVAKAMVTTSNNRSKKAFLAHSELISTSLRAEIEHGPISGVLQGLIDEQAERITSIPLSAAKRIQNMAVDVMVNGRRSSDLVEAVMSSGDVSASKARTIARTSVSSVNTALTRARCERIGSDRYRWRTARDSDVRRSHQEMEGKIVHWSDPPTLDNMTGHAGEFPNCRCYPEPIFDD